MTDLTQLSMSDLKALCTSYAIEPVGDKRLKATWVNAIETFQSQQTVIEIVETPLPAIDLPLTESDDLYMESDGSAVSPLPSQPQPIANTKRGASIVILMPLILLSVAIMAVQMSLRLVTPLIASVWRSTATWRSIPRSIYTSSLPLDYFPA